MAADMNSLVPAILRVTVFLVAAGLFSLALRRRTAAVRHLVWTAALAGALAIPFLSGALPRWTIPVWADLVPAQGVALFRVDAAKQAPTAARPLTAAVATSTPLSAKPANRATARDWRSSRPRHLVYGGAGGVAADAPRGGGRDSPEAAGTARAARGRLPGTRTQPGDGTRHGNPSPHHRRRNHADDLGRFPSRDPAALPSWWEVTRTDCGPCCSTSWPTSRDGTTFCICWPRRPAPSTGSIRWSGWRVARLCACGSGPATTWYSASACSRRTMRRRWCSCRGRWRRPGCAPVWGSPAARISKSACGRFSTQVCDAAV